MADVLASPSAVTSDLYSRKWWSKRGPTLRLALAGMWLGVLKWLLALGGILYFTERIQKIAAEQTTPALVAFSLGCTIWLSVPRWHSERRLLTAAPILLIAGVLLLLFGIQDIGCGMTWAAFAIWQGIPPRQPDAILRVTAGEPFACLSCGKTVAPDVPRCDGCGWSFVA